MYIDTKFGSFFKSVFFSYNVSLLWGANLSPAMAEPGARSKWDIGSVTSQTGADNGGPNDA